MFFLDVDDSWKSNDVLLNFDGIVRTYGDSVSVIRSFSKKRHDEKPVIGNNVDFGVNVTCIGNITIGDNAIIAIGSVVVHDVPDNAIVVGNPVRVMEYCN